MKQTRRYRFGVPSHLYRTAISKTQKFFPTYKTISIVDMTNSVVQFEMYHVIVRLHIHLKSLFTYAVKMF